MAFKTPRRTKHSDSRQSYEHVHETILARLSAVDEVEYLAALLPLVDRVHTMDVSEARALFVECARPWMTTEELLGFKLDVKPPPQQIHVVCAECNSYSWTLDERTATSMCNECGASRSIIGPTSSRYLPFDHEEVPASCPYRRANHFQEWLNSFMAKQGCSVPYEVYVKVEAEIKKHRITDYGVLNSRMLRSMLKALKLNKYYEHIPHLLQHFKGEQPPRITAELESELKNMFGKVTDAFDKVIGRVCPERRNFLSYSYCIYKLLQLVEKDDLLIYFPLLKSREKLAVQDKIWKEITLHLQWRYIPSV